MVAITRSTKKKQEATLHKRPNLGGLKGKFKVKFQPRALVKSYSEASSPKLKSESPESEEQTWEEELHGDKSEGEDDVELVELWELRKERELELAKAKLEKLQYEVEELKLRRELVCPCQVGD
ncbi:hypothetical protein FRC03_009813 [Tulasnella sp. 419]|nr:hypothetical protein FRC03_009813 [Tulasnella sp. 419]